MAVQSKYSSKEALRKWRSAVSIVQNPRRRFRHVADLAKSREAEKGKQCIQTIVDIDAGLPNQAPVLGIKINHAQAESVTDNVPIQASVPDRETDPTPLASAPNDKEIPDDATQHTLQVTTDATPRDQLTRETATKTAIVAMTISAAAIFTVWQVILENQVGYVMKTFFFKTCLISMYGVFLWGAVILMTTTRHQSFQGSIIFPRIAIVLIMLAVSLIVTQILKTT